MTKFNVINIFRRSIKDRCPRTETRSIVIINGGGGGE